MSGEEIVTEGCAIITEFVGQGAATGGTRSTGYPVPSPSSPSEGCAAITVISDQGFSPSSDEKKGAEKDGAQTYPLTGVV
jgi:hypothetical protein